MREVAFTTALHGRSGEVPKAPYHVRTRKQHGTPDLAGHDATKSQADAEHPAAVGPSLLEDTVAGRN